MTEKVSEIVRRAVNVHGQLHLDSVRTCALIGIIESYEKYEIEANKAIRSMSETVKAGAMLAEHVAHGMISNGDEA